MILSTLAGSMASWRRYASGRSIPCIGPTAAPTSMGRYDLRAYHKRAYELETLAGKIVLSWTSMGGGIAACRAISLRWRAVHFNRAIHRAARAPRRQGSFSFCGMFASLVLCQLLSTIAADPWPTAP
jgi:hypothetical protein